MLDRIIALDNYQLFEFIYEIVIDQVTAFSLAIPSPILSFYRPRERKRAWYVNTLE